MITTQHEFAKFMIIHICYTRGTCYYYNRLTSEVILWQTPKTQQSMEQSRLRCVIVTDQGQSKDMMYLVCFHYMISCQMQNPLGLDDQRYVNLYVHIIYIYLQIVYYKNFVGVICNITIIYIIIIIIITHFRWIML